MYQLMKFSQNRSFALTCLFFIALVAMGTGCSGTPMLKTTTIRFRCDSQFNDGLRLPVDLVYIPKDENAETVTKESPDEWFNSEAREQWQFKQSLSLRETDERQVVEVKLKKPAQTVSLVIIADYREIKTAEQQIIVLDTGAKENEDIFVTIEGILHRAH